MNHLRIKNSFTTCLAGIKSPSAEAIVIINSTYRKQEIKKKCEKEKPHTINILVFYL